MPLGLWSCDQNLLGTVQNSGISRNDVRRQYY